MSKIRIYIYLKTHTFFYNKINTILTLKVSILIWCRPLEPELTLLLGGDYNEFLRRALFANVPVALIGETGSSRFNALEKYALTRYSFTLYQNFKFFNFLRKVHRFVLVASSQPILRSILQKTKDSPWANSDGFFILVDTQTEFRGCTNARSFLWTAWKYDLLSVIFMCVEPDGIFYYTHNPYSNSTPPDWNEVERVKGRNGHPYIIMKRRFVHNRTICNNLDFDKTDNLKGYLIRLNAVEIEPFIKVNLSAPKLEKFLGDNSEIIKILLLKQRASLVIELYNATPYALGGIGPNGTFEDMMAPVSDGTVDIGMNTRFLFALWKVKYTYPHTKSGICVITQPVAAISEFTKLITFMSPEIIVGIIMICLLIYVLFVKNDGYVKAGLQVIRLMVCVGVLRPPEVNSTRIFLCMALILFLNISALFQSHLSSLLTLPIYVRDIDSVEGLKRAGYTIYGPANLKSFLGDPVLESRFVGVSYDECKEHVENSSTAACLGECYHMYYRIKGGRFTMSRTLREVTQSYVTREDWPLYNQVDHIIQLMSQAGLILKSQSESFLEITRNRKKRSSMKKGFKVMLLKQLAFSFYFLIFGYVCAIIVFILELVIARSATGSENWKKINNKRKKRKA
ncbi:uncharacterized protein [Linepithema humile]|uniref:uncharacterized protein n=1 Tax=Linepithema humile TaxID=83485 RepID=UPI00351E2D7A